MRVRTNAATTINHSDKTNTVIQVIKSGMALHPVSGVESVIAWFTVLNNKLVLTADETCALYCWERRLKSS